MIPNEHTTVGVTGHQGLPDGVADFVRGCLAKLFPHPSSVLVFCSLAEGADQLVARWFLDAGASLTVIVPSRRYESTFTSAAARAGYEHLLARAASVYTLDFMEPSEEAFLDAGHRVVDESDKVVAVWDGRPSRGKGGTADIVHRARELRKDVEILWPVGVSR